jgi:hypothetical protein
MKIYKHEKSYKNAILMKNAQRLIYIVHIQSDCNTRYLISKLEINAN